MRNYLKQCWGTIVYRTVLIGALSVMSYGAYNFYTALQDGMTQITVMITEYNESMLLENPIRNSCNVREIEEQLDDAFDAGFRFGSEDCGEIYSEPQ